MKTFLLNIPGLNELGYLACDRLGNSLILVVHAEKSSVFFLFGTWSQSAIGKGLIGSRLWWIFHELVRGAEWLGVELPGERIAQTLRRVFRGRAGLIKGFLTAPAYRPSIYAAVASGSISIWSSALVNERGKLCRFISISNLRRCLRDVFLWGFLNGESSQNGWAMTAKDSSRELATPESEIYIRTFKEQMHLELELPKLPGNRPTSPKISPRSSPRNSPCFFRKLLVNKSIRQRRRFTVAHTW